MVPHMVSMGHYILYIAYEKNISLQCPSCILYNKCQKNILGRLRSNKKGGKPWKAFKEESMVYSSPTLSLPQRLLNSQISPQKTLHARIHRAGAPSTTDTSDGHVFTLLLNKSGVISSRGVRGGMGGDVMYVTFASPPTCLILRAILLWS